MQEAEPWTCPHCNRPTTITSNLRDSGKRHLAIGETRHGDVGVAWNAVRCPNPQCNELTISVRVAPGYFVDIEIGPPVWMMGEECLNESRLRPESLSKPQPDYIPRQLRDDYFEACRIRNLSPKAAATLARRCLQGIIRDFWKIKKRRLVDEIQALKEDVDDSLWQAIDAVRKVGNIGAHMESDVNTIVDIEPEEAHKLIGLVEILFEECYAARHQRQRRLADLAALGERKSQERQNETR